VQQDDLIGTWLATGYDTIYQFHADETVTITHTRPYSPPPAQAAWQFTDERHFQWQPPNKATGELLGPTILAIYSGDVVAYWQKSVDGRKPLPLAPDGTVVPLPLFDVATVQRIQYRSTYAPAPDDQDIQFVLKQNAAAGDFVGHAEYYLESSWVTATLPITLSQQMVDDSLVHFANAPLWSGAYAPQYTHTDDYPDLRLEIVVADQTIIFGTSSQGQTHIPWKMTIDGQPYVTFEDTIFVELLKLREQMWQQIWEQSERTGVAD
jgi:hypothetical protein